MLFGNVLFIVTRTWNIMTRLCMLNVNHVLSSVQYPWLILNTEQVSRSKMATQELLSGKCLVHIFARLSIILRDYVLPLPLQADALIVLNLGFQSLFGLLAINFWGDGTE